MSSRAIGPELSNYGKSPLVKYTLMLVGVAAASVLMWPGLLRNLFSSDFMPHGMCLLWQPKLLWLHVVSDTAIGVSYVAISLTLAWLVHRGRRDIPFSWIFLAFGMFIIACGATHLMEVVTLWYPFYWLSGDVKLITAIASVATAIVLPPLVPKTLRLIEAAKTSEQRRALIEAQNRELEAMTRRLEDGDTTLLAQVSDDLPQQELNGQSQDVEHLAHEARLRRFQLKSALEALRASEERFRSAVEAVPQLVWTSEPDGASDYHNQRWYDYTGMTREQAEGWGWQSVLHPDDAELCRSRWKHAVSTGDRYEIEYRFRRHDGLYRWHLGRAVPLRDGGGRIVKWFGTATDIDDQKQAEITKQELAAIVEGSDDAIIGEALDGTITSWNRGAEMMYGYKANEIVGRPIWLLCPPDRVSEVREIIERVKRGERTEHMQTVRKTKDGRLIDVLVSISIMRNPAGEITGASTIARDITELKRAEQALRNSEKHAMVGRLSAIMAHEINNPLEAVLNVLYLLGKTPTLDDEGLKHLSVATQEMGRIAHIVKQTLGFYRESPMPIKVKVPELVDDVVGLYASKLAEKRIAIERRYEDVGDVTAFPSEIRQVFSNLIINAIEATVNGGKIKVHIFASRDWSGTNRYGVRVVISDTGTGIAPQHRRDLFEPFFTTKGEKGTGLGLWVSNGIVQKHGGSIRVRSSVGPGAAGTCFAVFLPSEVAGTERREQKDITVAKSDVA
jgi:PAS domain S-box-containing protein